MHRFIRVGNDDHVDVPVADNLWVVLKVSGQEPYVLFAVATCVNGVERERRWHWYVVTHGELCNRREMMDVGEEEGIKAGARPARSG